MDCLKSYLFGFLLIYVDIIVVFCQDASQLDIPTDVISILGEGPQVPEGNDIVIVKQKDKIFIFFWASNKILKGKYKYVFCQGTSQLDVPTDVISILSEGPQVPECNTVMISKKIL